MLISLVDRISLQSLSQFGEKTCKARVFEEVSEPFHNSWFEPENISLVINRL